MTTTNQEAIRAFYHRLNHRSYGVTELVIIDPNGEQGIIATGFFNDSEAFVKACLVYNGQYNIYAGRNPRPAGFPRTRLNELSRVVKQRARDVDIVYITAMSLDIDPVRPCGTSSSDLQHGRALNFGVQLQKALGGYVDDSGNGAYLWFAFNIPIKLTDENRDTVKQQCRRWQRHLVKTFQPEKHGLRIDGCFDLSRVKKVIGTVSMKGSIHRTSRNLIQGTACDQVRDQILAMPPSPMKTHRIPIQHPLHAIPDQFLKLLHTNPVIQNFWCTPDEDNDTSKHDWRLLCACVEQGITIPEHLASILAHNPFGKFRREHRLDYLRTTVNKILQSHS